MNNKRGFNFFFIYSRASLSEVWPLVKIRCCISYRLSHKSCQLENIWDYWNRFFTCHMLKWEPIKCLFHYCTHRISESCCFVRNGYLVCCHTFLPSFNMVYRFARQQISWYSKKILQSYTTNTLSKLHTLPY